MDISEKRIELRQSVIRKDREFIIKSRKESLESSSSSSMDFNWELTRLQIACTHPHMNYRGNGYMGCDDCGYLEY